MTQLYCITSQGCCKCTGYLEPAQNEGLISISDTVVLSAVVTTSATLPAIQSARDLSWYRNGIKLTPDFRQVLSDGNMTLTLSPTLSSDVGIYDLLFDGLEVYPFDQSCERAVLELVRTYPIMSPATFILYNTGMFIMCKVKINFLGKRKYRREEREREREERERERGERSLQYVGYCLWNVQYCLFNFLF